MLPHRLSEPGFLVPTGSKGTSESFLLKCLSSESQRKQLFWGGDFLAQLPSFRSVEVPFKGQQWGQELSGLAICAQSLSCPVSHLRLHLFPGREVASDLSAPAPILEASPLSRERG